MKTTTLLLSHHIKIASVVCAFITSAFFGSSLWAQVEICKVPWIPPVYDVSETHWDVPTSFWQNGGHIPENTVDEDTTNYARAHIKASGSATLRITDEDTSYAGGSFVGYLVKCRAFRDTIFDGVTISTYLDGALQESYTGDELWIEYIPFYVNDPICLGFETTLPWNEIEIHMDTAGGRVHYDVFYAVVDGECITESELPPGGLAVSWVSFEVQKKGEASDLKWTTAQEFNNAGYQVERSADGRLFETIGNVPASSEPRDNYLYSYTDARPNKGMNFYRIRQVDLDGQISYSPVRGLSFNSGSLAITTWPNPVSESLFIQMPSDIQFAGEIKLISATGSVVLNQSFEESIDQATLDLSGIDPGLYSLIIQSGDSRFVDKIVVLK